MHQIQQGRQEEMVLFFHIKATLWSLLSSATMSRLEQLQPPKCTLL